MNTNSPLRSLLRACLAILLLCGGTARFARSEDLPSSDVPPAAAATPQPLPATDPPSPLRPERDPFTTTETMRQLAGAQQQPVAPVAAPLVPTKIPDLKLRGLILDRRQPPLGLLEIPGSGTFLVRKGDRFHPRIDGQVTSLEIVDVDERGVTVQFPGTGTIQIR